MASVGDKTAVGLGVLQRAGVLAKDFGGAFVVFVGGFASSATSDVGAARHEAREQAKRVGRDCVAIKRIKV